MEDSKAKKSILPIIIGIVAIVAVVGIVWLVMSRNKGGETADNSTTSETTDATKVTSSELAAGKVSDEISYGDYTAMFTLAKAIQNGQKTGAIVSIDGVVSHKVSSYSVGQNNPEKNKESVDYVGTVFTIQDGEAADYPKDGERITIVAKVIEVSPLNFQLVTLKNFVKSR